MNGRIAMTTDTLHKRSVMIDDSTNFLIQAAPKLSSVKTSTATIPNDTLHRVIVYRHSRH